MKGKKKTDEDTSAVSVYIALVLKEANTQRIRGKVEGKKCFPFTSLLGGGGGGVAGMIRVELGESHGGGGDDP